MGFEEYVKVDVAADSCGLGGIAGPRCFESKIVAARD